MAFPWIQYDNFEDGTLGSFTSEPDTLGKLDFPGPQDDLDVPPYRGGYVMRVSLDRGTADAYVQHDTSFDIGNGTTRYLRFYLMLSSDFKMPRGTRMRIVRWYNGANESVSLVLDRSDPNIEDFVLTIFDQDTGEYIRGLVLPTGKWMCIECVIAHANTTGLITFQYNKNSLQLNRASFGTSPFTHWQLGAMGQDEHIRGTLYFDEVIVDDEKLQQPEYIDPQNLTGQTFLMTKTGYAFVGPGELKSATIIGGAAGNSALFYDTDRRPYSHHNLKASLKVSSTESKEMTHGPIVFEKGCYVVLTGSGGTQPTDPQLLVMLGRVGQQALIPHMVPELVAAE